MRQQVSFGSKLESGLLFMEEGCELGGEKTIKNTGRMQHSAEVQVAKATEAYKRAGLKMDAATAGNSNAGSLGTAKSEDSGAGAPKPTAGSAMEGEVEAGAATVETGAAQGGVDDEGVQSFVIGAGDPPRGAATSTMRGVGLQGPP